VRSPGVGALFLVFAVLFGVACHHDAPPAEVTVAAAASLRSALPELLRAYAAQHPQTKIAATYGASGDLRRQVEGGAPIDAVLFASAAPVDEMIASGHADASTRRVFGTNQLVLIAPKGAKPLTFATLASLPKDARVAVGDPRAVPAGDYARRLLQKLGVWDALQGRLVLGGDVAAVLEYARRGEVDAAIVYRTDVRGVDDVVVLDEAKGDAAPRIELVAAVVKGTRMAGEAGAFVGYLVSPEGQAILRGFGFGAP
jgi:molybdate transport system substrate-binding protein